MQRVQDARWMSCWLMQPTLRGMHHLVLRSLMWQCQRVYGNPPGVVENMRQVLGR